ncbi:MAG: endonuclease III [Candidatus Altiarchaeota archaeon]
MTGKIDPQKVLRLLRGEYPAAPKTSLTWGNPLQLLVATILSAQCTDERVNKVTVDLFRKYISASDYANADLRKLEKDVRSTGFYRNKARNIKAAAAMIVRDFEGKVPESMEDLIKLPGVARKTANIVLTAGYGRVEGVAVDTHVRRLSGRIGLSRSDDPVKVERELMALYQRKDWADINMLLVAHGRKVCNARKPLCRQCMLDRICPRVGVKAIN